MTKHFRTAETKGRGYGNPLPFDIANKNVEIIKYHDFEGITKDMIEATLEESDTKFHNVHNIRGSYVSSFFVTRVIKRMPPIRLTVIFRETPDTIVVTNAYLGTINMKNLWEKKGV